MRAYPIPNTEKLKLLIDYVDKTGNFPPMDGWDLVLATRAYLEILERNKEVDS